MILDLTKNHYKLLIQLEVWWKVGENDLCIEIKLLKDISDIPKGTAVQAIYEWG